jgi:heme exporter protein C
MKKQKQLFGIFILLISLIVVIIVSPSEKTLGNIVKLVYLHLAIAWTGLLFFAISAIFGLSEIISQKTFWRYSLATQRTALLLWILYIISSFIVAYLAWGGMNWGEPRLRIGFMILSLAIAASLLTLAFEKPKAIGAINFALGVIVWGFWATRFNVLHPASPVWRSNSLAIKTSALFILILTLAIAALFSATILPNPKEKIR